MDQTADRRPVSAEARVFSKALPREIYQTVSPVSISTSMLHTH